MPIKNKIVEFNKRWNINMGSRQSEESQRFKDRVLNVLDNVDRTVGDDGAKEFCNIVGIRWNVKSVAYSGVYYENIIDAFKKESDEKGFYYLLQVLFWISFPSSYARKELIQKIKKVVDLSNINLSMSINGEEVIFYPKGEDLLDKELIEKALAFLKDKPLDHFVWALESHGEGKSSSYVKAAEHLRRCLEEYSRFKLKNNQGLKENIKEIAAQLKPQVDPQIRTIFVQTLNCLDQYFNENSKHNDGDITEPEIEYLIYQVAILLKLISKCFQ